MNVIQGSLTADAILSRTREFATRTIDGVLMKLIFRDDFNRVVEKGLGGTWAWVPYDSRYENADLTILSVDGSALNAMDPVVGDHGYESQTGFPLPITGDLFFDFHTANGAGSQQYGFIFDNVAWTGIYATRLNSTSNDWKLETYLGDDPFYTFTPVLGAWYRVHLRWTSSAVHARVWKVGDPEPSTWHYTSTSNYGLESITATPFLDLYWVPPNPLVAMMDNIEVWTTQAQWTFWGGFQIAANLSSNIFQLNVNAILRKTIGNGTTTLPTYASHSTFTSNSTNSFLIDRPAGTSSGDLLIAIIGFDSQSYWNLNFEPARPSWDQPPTTAWQLVQNQPTPNRDVTVSIWSRRAGSSEPAQYGFAETDAWMLPSVAATILRIQDADSLGSVVDVYTADNGPATNHSTPSMNAASEGLLIVAAVGSVDNIWDPPSGMTEQVDIRSTWASLGVFTQPISNSEIGVKTAVSSASSATLIFGLMLRATGRFFRLSSFIGSVLRIIRSFNANSYIVNPYRTQHPRDNTAQYDFDLDTVITIAESLGMYANGQDLHSVLTSVVGRVTELENVSNS